MVTWAQGCACLSSPENPPVGQAPGPRAPSPSPACRGPRVPQPRRGSPPPSAPQGDGAHRRAMATGMGPAPSEGFLGAWLLQQGAGPTWADGPLGHQAKRATDTISPAGTRAAFVPRTGRAEAPSATIPARCAQAQGRGQVRSPEGARGRPSRSQSQERKRPEAGSRPRGPWSVFTRRSAATQQEITLPRHGGRAGEPCRAAPPKGCSQRPAPPVPAARGEPAPQLPSMEGGREPGSSRWPQGGRCRAEAPRRAWS